MNREELLEVLTTDERHWGKVHTSSAHNNGWSFIDGQYVHTIHDPITIDDWNRAKIKPNTVLKVVDEDHLELISSYIDDLGFKFWWTSREDCLKKESFYLHFEGDMDVVSLSSPTDTYKEIFIELPKQSTPNEMPRFGCVMQPNIDAKVLAEKVGSKHSHYFKDVSKLTEVDVYRVCDLFDVHDTSGAIQHAIKKLLCSGQRGVKDFQKDIQEAVDTLNRKLEIMKEDNQ